MYANTFWGGGDAIPRKPELRRKRIEAIKEGRKYKVLYYPAGHSLSGEHGCVAMGRISGEAIFNHCCLEVSGAGGLGERRWGNYVSTGSSLCLSWAKITPSSCSSHQLLEPSWLRPGQTWVPELLQLPPCRGAQWRLCSGLTPAAGSEQLCGDDTCPCWGHFS